MQSEFRPEAAIVITEETSDDIFIAVSASSETNAECRERAYKSRGLGPRDALTSREEGGDGEKQSRPP